MFCKKNKYCLDAFNSKIYPIKIEITGFSDKASAYSKLKILSPK